MHENQLAAQVVGEVKKAVVGKDEAVVKTLLAILARGHVLLEDIPGVGKTTMAIAFSKALGLKYNRVQFTPDVMPSDITGFSIYNKETGKIIADLICLVDEEYDSKNSLLLFDPIETWKKTHLAPDSYTLRELMVPVFLNGTCVYESPRVMDIQKYCKKELATLWEASLRLEYPHRTHVDLSMPLWKMRNQLLDQYHFND